MSQRPRFSLGLVLICVGVFFLVISPLIMSQAGQVLFALIGATFLLAGMYLRSKGR